MKKKLKRRKSFFVQNDVDFSKQQTSFFFKGQTNFPNNSIGTSLKQTEQNLELTKVVLERPNWTICEDKNET